jgi:hypothetical protein
MKYCLTFSGNEFREIVRIVVAIRILRDTDKIQSGSCMRVTMFKLKMIARIVMTIGIAMGCSWRLMKRAGNQITSAIKMNVRVHGILGIGYDMKN